MDKEKNNDIENNIDDVLKLLKNTYENKNDTSEYSHNENDRSDSENITPEQLSERLREQFMGGGEVFSEDQNSEYDIDETLISEFLDESNEAALAEAMPELKEEVPEIVVQELDCDEQNDRNESIPEAQESSLAADNDESEPDREINVAYEEGQIVEIVIPFVESLKAEGDEADDYASDAEENDDFYDEQTESSENSYICFADENVNDEEIFQEEGAEEDEDIYESEFSLKDIADDDVPNAEDEELPWYSDDELLVNEKKIADVQITEQADIILPVDDDESDDVLDVPNDFEAAIDEELGEENIEDAHQIDIGEVLMSASPISDEISMPVWDSEGDVFIEEGAEAVQESAGGGDKSEGVNGDNDDQRPVYKLFSDTKTHHQSTKADEEQEDTSFYRTIIAARTERELQYGYPRTAPADTEDTVDTEPFGEDQQRDGSFETPEPLYEQNKQEDTVAPHIAVTDYYGAGEQDEDPDEDINRDGESVESSIEFEHDVHSELDLQEKEKSALLKIVKPIILGILALVILVLEMMPVLKIVPEGFFDYTSYPVPYILIDAQLLIFMVALCYEKLLDGLLKIVKPVANFYSLLSVTVIVTLLCSVISCFCATDEMPRLYNFVSACYLFALSVIERVDKKRRKESEMVLDGKKVYSLRHSQGKNSTAEKMYLGGVDPDTDILEPIEIISDDFRPAFAREKIDRNKNFYNSVIVGAIVPSVIFSIFMAVLSIVFERGLFVTVNSFAFAFVSIAPLCAIVSYYLPILVSNKRLFDRECVISGYESACEVADCDAFVFNDCHMFKECNAKEAGIKLYCDDAKTRELFVCLAAAYSKIGGPMQSTFSSVLGEKHPNVNMIRITRNGFESVIDNRTNLIVGSSEYLSRYGIITDRADTRESGVIYAALNSVLCAKISVMYRTQPLFEALCDILEEYGIRTVIETYDPMISGKYVAKCRGESSNSISVVHKNINDYNLPEREKAHLGRAGVFATSSRLKLVELIGFCKRIKLIRKLNTGILIGSYAFSGLLCTLFVIGGAIESANLLWALLYQMALTAICVFACIKLLPLSFEAMQEKKIRDEIKKQEKENRNQI